MQPMAGALEFVEKLHGIARLAVVSSAQTDVITGLLESVGKLNLFDTVVGGDEREYHAGRIELALERLGIEVPKKPGNIFMVDDSPERYAVAQSMNINFIGVLTGGATRGEFESSGTATYKVFKDLKSEKAFEAIMG